MYLFQNDLLTQPQIKIKVIPNGIKTEIVTLLDDGTIKIRIKAIAEDGKANKELLRFLKQETGVHWDIIQGKTSRNKILKRLS